MCFRGMHFISDRRDIATFITMVWSGKNSTIYKGVRVAVFGAAGFIGRWVSNALCALGAKVYLIVRDRENSEKIFCRFDIDGNIVKIDLKDIQLVQMTLTDIKPSITFNLAGYGIDKSENDQETSYKINADLVTALSRAVKLVQDPGWTGQDIVHAGSALEYGTISGDLHESSEPAPTTVYGRSKLKGAYNLKRSCEDLGIKGVTARLFTVYGPGEHEGRLLPSLVDARRTGKDIPLTAGTQKRDFTYVEDVAKGLLMLGLAKTHPGEIVNLATGRLTSVRRFVELAAHVLGIPAEKLKFGLIPTRPEEMENDEVSIRRLRELISWIPETGIEEGVSMTLDFANSHGREGEINIRR
jgi:UDP-glucose 4-epimerase